MFDKLIAQMTQCLRNLDGFLDKGAALAEAKSFDANILLQARLAPDMFPLVKQVQSACDTAKFAAARLSGKTAPSDPDDEATIEELKARVHKTIAYLESFEAADFAGASERHIVLPFRPNHYALGVDYYLQFALPNFYFHTTTAYAILRHNGAELGKMDFIGSVALHPLDK